MDLTRSTLGLAAAATLGGLAGLTLTRLRNHRASTPRFRFRDHSGGCHPDGCFVDNRITVHDIDGSHQGFAVAMLRERLAATAAAGNDSTDASEEATAAPAPLQLDYTDSLRACIEVAINVALNLAEDDLTGCTCDDDCDEAETNVQMLHLLAGSKMVLFAQSFHRDERAHARECRACAKAGRLAPAALRAQFCRDVADDLLTNFYSDSTDLTGVPVDAAMDVLLAMLEVRSKTAEISIQDQITDLTTSVAHAVAHNEGHRALNPGND